MQRLLYLVAALLLTVAFLGFSYQPVFADSTGFLSLINSYREQNNLGTLSEDQNLTNAACWLSADLEKNGFNHTDSLNRAMAQRLSAFGVSANYEAENIFYTTYSSSASDAFTAWKNSPGHNANMLGANYTRIGIGRVLVNNKWYWTTDFASGSATSLTSQCGISVNPPSPPVAKPPSLPPTPPAVPVTINETPPDEVPVATNSSSAIDINKEATLSATVPAKIVTINEPKSNDNSVTKSLVAGTFFAGSFIFFLILFGLMGWLLFHHFRLPEKIHEEI